MSDSQRQMMLQNQISVYISQGWELQSQTPFSAVFVKRKKINHILHLLLSLVTGGIWLIGWLVIVLMNSNAQPQTKIISVDETGSVTAR